MVDVAVEEGGISDGTNGGEDRLREGLVLATEVGSGAVAVSLSLLEQCLSVLHPDSHFNCLHIIYLPYQTTEDLCLGSGFEEWCGGCICRGPT